MRTLINELPGANEIKMLEKADKMLLNGEYEEVISLSEKAIKKFPHQMFFYTIKSIAHSQLGDIQTAFEILKNAEKKFPYDYELLFQLAKVYEDMSDFENAEKYYYESFDNTPVEYHDAKSDCLNDIGALKYKLGFEEEACELWERALEINPENEKAKNNLNYFSEEDDEDELINQYVKNFSIFESVQRSKYLIMKNKKKFSSKKEEKEIFRYIEVKWVNETLNNPDMSDTEDEEALRQWSESIETDYSKPVEAPVFSVPQTELKKIIDEKFSFLPENGFLSALLVKPALDYVGLKENILEEIISGEKIISEKEKELFRWTYKAGNILIELGMTINKKEQEKLFEKLYNTLLEKLDINGAEMVMTKIIREGEKIKNEFNN